MDARLEQFFARQREEIEAEKRRQSEEREAREQKQWERDMEEMGLYEEEREYVETSFQSIQMAVASGYKVDNVDGELRYYKMKHIYPKLTGEEKAALRELLDDKRSLGLIQDGGEQPRASEGPEPVHPEPARPEPVQTVTVAVPPAEPVEYAVQADYDRSGSFGGMLMRILAVVMWIGGFIAAIVLSRTPVVDRYGDIEMQFNFGLFMLYLVLFAVAGATYFAIGELFDNVNEIRAGIGGLTRAALKPKKK